MSIFSYNKINGTKGGKNLYDFDLRLLQRGERVFEGKGDKL